MDTAPIVKFLPNGSVDEWDYRKVRHSYDVAQRKAQVDRYRGILCALCDEPFERHSSDWTCQRRVAPRFKFPAECIPQSVSPYGDAGDALDYALDHINDSFERTDFLESWREDDVCHWPEYFDWLHTQRAGAASADTHPKDGDAQQAPLVSGAVPKGDAQ